MRLKFYLIVMNDIVVSHQIKSIIEDIFKKDSSSINLDKNYTA